MYSKEEFPDAAPPGFHFEWHVNNRRWIACCVSREMSASRENASTTMHAALSAAYVVSVDTPAPKIRRRSTNISPASRKPASP